MTIRSRNTSRSLRCETLEGRKLMAADLVVLDAVEVESVEMAPQPGSLSAHQPSGSWETPAAVTQSFEHKRGYDGPFFAEQFDHATSADETGDLAVVDFDDLTLLLAIGANPGVAEVSHFDGPQFDDIRGVLNGPGWDKGLIHDTGQVGQVEAGTYDWETVYGF